MKWLVIWAVTLYVPTECPDFKPDPYTGEYPMMHCLVLHQKEITRNFKKKFKTREAAEEFVKAAPDTVRENMHIEKVR